MCPSKGSSRCLSEWGAAFYCASRSRSIVECKFDPHWTPDISGNTIAGGCFAFGGVVAMSSSSRIDCTRLATQKAARNNFNVSSLNAAYRVGRLLIRRSTCRWWVWRESKRVKSASLYSTSPKERRVLFLTAWETNLERLFLVSIQFHFGVTLWGLNFCPWRLKSCCVLLGCGVYGVAWYN